MRWKKHPVFASFTAAWLNGLGNLAGTAAAAHSMVACDWPQEVRRFRVPMNRQEAP